MQKHTLKIYETEATIYEYSFEEHQNGTVKVEGIPEELKAEGILFGRQYHQDGKRKFSSYVAKGFSPTAHSVVLAENIDQKQLANILIAIGMIDGVAYETDVKTVSVKDMIDEHISAEDISDVSLGEGEFVGSTISTEDIQPKKKKKRK